MGHENSVTRLLLLSSALATLQCYVAEAGYVLQYHSPPGYIPYGVIASPQPSYHGYYHHSIPVEDPKPSSIKAAILKELGFSVGQTIGYGLRLLKSSWHDKSEKYPGYGYSYNYKIRPYGNRPHHSWQ